MSNWTPNRYYLSRGTRALQNVGGYAKYLGAPIIAGGAYLGYSKYRSKPKSRGKYLRKKKPVSMAKANKSRIKYLNKKMNNNEATILFRSRTSDLIATGAVNQCFYNSKQGNDKSVIEDAITTLKFFDPSSPATLQTVDYNTGSFQKSILVKSSSQINLKNNYKVPCRLKLYMCSVRSDTNNNPAQALIAGFNDIGGLSATNPLSRTRDSKILLDLWNVKKIKDIILQPAQECSASHYGKSFSYDTSLVDTHNQEFVKIFDSYQWLVRVEGCNAHDTVEDEQGRGKAGVDVIIDRTHIVKYDAGVDLFEIQTNNTADNFSNQPVQTILDNTQQQFNL